MIHYFYSPTTNSFFSSELTYSSLPLDKIVITEQIFKQIQNTLSTTASELYSDEKGFPATRSISHPVIAIDPLTEADQLLDKTDKYVLRCLEIGQPIPSDIHAAREKAREILNKGREE